MKKKILAFSLCLCTIVSMAGCGKNDSANEKKTDAKITVTDYKGLKVAKSTATVTDEELQSYIDSILYSKRTTETVKEGKTAENDTVMVEYTATMDGKEVSELSTTSAVQISLTDDGFAIDGFTKKLIGKKVGKTVEFDIKIQDDFETEKYAGKTVHFKVKINSIQVTTTPELTDKWVKENYEFLNLSTKKEFKSYFKDGYRTSEIIDDIWEDFVDEQKVDSYDSDEVKKYSELYEKNFESQLQYNYGVGIDAYCEAMSMKKEDFKKEMETEAKKYLKEKMVVNYIADKEGIKLEKGEYEKKMLEYAKSMNLETQKDLEEYYKGTMDTEDFKYAMIAEKVQKFIVDNVKVVPDKELEKETTASENETEKTDKEDSETDKTDKE